MKIKFTKNDITDKLWRKIISELFGHFESMGIRQCWKVINYDGRKTFELLRIQ